MDTIKKTLSELGFDTQEIAIYISLLKKKDQAAYTISKDTGIPRSTVYLKLEHLEKRDIVSSWLKNKVRFFSIENPKKLLTTLQDKQKALEATLPHILDIYASKSIHPTAKTYSGVTGIKSAFQHILETIHIQHLREIHVYTNPLLTELIPDFYRKWIKEKDKTGCKTWLLVPPRTPLNTDFTSNQYRETRVIKNDFKHAGSVAIYGHFVSFFSYNEKEPHVITIESKTISETLRDLFLCIWQDSK